MVDVPEFGMLLGASATGPEHAGLGWSPYSDFHAAANPNIDMRSQHIEDTKNTIQQMYDRIIALKARWRN